MKTLLTLALITAGMTTASATLVNLDAESDTYVRLGLATTNFGNAPDIPVKNSGASSTTRQGYLRFDVSSLLGETIQDVTLSLDMTTNNNGGNPQDPTPAAYTITVYGLNDGNVGETWVEGNGGTDNTPAGEINWNNAPDNDTANNGILGTDTTNLGSFVTPAINPANNGGPVPVTFSSQALADFVTSDSDGNATLILVRTSANGVGNNLAFASKEHATAGAPALAINTIPEPGSAALLLLGCTVLGVARRKAV